MSDIVSFLTAQLDTDETVARACIEPFMLGERTGLGPFKGLHPQLWRHVAQWTPARVLAEVAAKRVVVAAESRVRTAKPEYAGTHVAFSGDGIVRINGAELSFREYEERYTQAPEPSLVLRALASVYAGAEGWDPAWGMGTEVGA